MKIQSLIEKTQQLENEGNKNLEEWRLVKKSFKKLARSIDRKYKEKVLGVNEATTTVQSLRPVAKWIKDNKELKKIKPVKGVWIYRTPDGVKCEEIPQESLIEELKRNKVKISDSLFTVAEQFKEIANLPMSNVLQEINEIKTLCGKAWTAHENVGLYTGLLHYIRQLPIEESFWNGKMPKSDAEKKQLIENLAQISEFFFKACLSTPQAHELHIEKIYVLQKIMYLQHLTLKSLFPDTPIHFNFNYISNPSLTKLPDAKMQKELAVANQGYSQYRINTYFYTNADKMGYSIGENPYMSEARRPIDLVNTPPVREDPNVKQWISAQGGDFHSKSILEQTFILHQSNALPNWATAMRNTDLALHYLLNAQLEQTSFDNPNAPLNFEFSIEEKKKEEIKVNISLKGITSFPPPKSPIPFSYRDNLAHDRFYFTHRPLTNDSMINFVKYLVNRTSEKKLLLRNPNDISYDSSKVDEDLYELAHLFTNDALKIVDTLEFFTKYPEKIKDLNYQTLFQILCFSKNWSDISLALGILPLLNF